MLKEHPRKKLSTPLELSKGNEVTNPLKAIAAATKEKCRKEANLSDQEYNDCANRKVLPTTDDGKCCPVCACWMRELGYMTNGQLNLVNMKKVNSQKWRNPDHIARANEIDESCTRKIETEGKKACQIALEFKRCKSETIKEKGGPPPPEFIA